MQYIRNENKYNFAIRVTKYFDFKYILITLEEKELWSNNLLQLLP